MALITIKFLAEMAGVSPKTVSKAINDRPGVREETRQAIKALAKEYNYYPNGFGRGLKGNSSKTIGVIVSDNANPNSAYHIKGMESRARLAGYMIILCNANEDYQQEERCIRLFLERRVDGIIFSPSPLLKGQKRASISMLQDVGIPFVVTNRSLEQGQYNSAKTDDVLGGRLATEHLIAKGYRDIIHLTINSQTSTVNDRKNAFLSVMRENGQDASDRVFSCARHDIRSAYDETARLLRDNIRFRAMFAFSDTVAFGAMQALHDLKLRIPEDVAVIGYDDVPYSCGFSVPLTTIRQDGFDIGVTAVDLLIKQIEDPATQPRQVLFQPSLIQRAST